MKDYEIFANKIREVFGGTPTSENLVETLRTHKFYPTEIVFDDKEHIGPRELAKAMPDKPVKWSKYTIYVRPFLQNDLEGLALILAHELFHITFGPIRSEKEADTFGALVHGLSYDEYRAKIKQYASLLR